MRAGIGFDVHAFDEARPLVLGGVRIRDHGGLAGHSDADVVCHAVADAVLGAAGMGDIGRHFPDSDPAWQDASSLDLLGRVAAMLDEGAFALRSVDVTVVIESPTLAGHRAEMAERMANALGVVVDVVHVKATTTDGLGLVGRGEGAASLAVAIVTPQAT